MGHRPQAEGSAAAKEGFGRAGLASEGLFLRILAMLEVVGTACLSVIRWTPTLEW